MVRTIGLVALLLAIIYPSAAFAQGTPWTQRVVSGPSARRDHAMAYDSARGVTVLFGGNTGSLNAETWEWNGTAWTQLAVTGPSAREQHAMAYDSARGVTVLFGGNSGNDLNDTWEWNGTAWTQRAVSGPSRRSGHAMAYDSARGVTVLFGWGGVGDAETWEWNGTAWTQRVVSGPSIRYHHRMAYDVARGVTVLFGGYGPFSPGTIYGDTWEWNGTAWTQRQVSGPAATYHHAMVYDSARGVTLMFAGDRRLNGVGTLSAETWEWDGAAWTQRVISGPSARSRHAMVYDSARGVAVLFGGRGTGNTYFADTWEARFAPTITTQPAPTSTCPSGSATMTVGATDTAPPTYQWQVESPAGSGTYVDLVGTTFSEPATGLSFVTSGAATDTLGVSYIVLGAHAASINFRARVTGAIGTTTSNPAAMTVCTTDQRREKAVYRFENDLTWHYAGTGGAAAIYDEITLWSPATINSITYGFVNTLDAQAYFRVRIRFFARHDGTTTPPWDPNSLLYTYVSPVHGEIGLWAGTRTSSDYGVPVSFFLSPGVIGVLLECLDSTGTTLHPFVTPMAQARLPSIGSTPTPYYWRDWVPGVPNDGVIGPGDIRGDATTPRSMAIALTSSDFAAIPTSTEISITNNFTQTCGTLATAPTGVVWYRMITPYRANMANLTFLDIDSEGSNSNVAIALFRQSDGGLVASDERDGSGENAQLTFGTGRRAAVGDGRQYDGRDSPLVDYERYFLAVAPGGTRFSDGFGVHTSFATAVPGEYCINWRASITPPLPPLVAPNEVVDVSCGLVAPGTVLPSVHLPAYEVVWYRLVLPEASSTSGRYVDLDLSADNTQTDPIALLFDDQGNLMALDDDSGVGLWPQLSFGATSPPRPPLATNSQAFSGQNGPLAEGSYFLGVSIFGQSDYAPSQFNLIHRGATDGNITLALRTNATGAPPVSIQTQPTNVTTCPSRTAAFSVTAAGTGTAPLTYQWRKGGTPINTTTNPSAATATLTLTNVQAGDAGSYDCIVSNACGSVTSTAATLTVSCPNKADVAGFGNSPGCDGQVTVDDLVFFLAKFFDNDVAVADIVGPGGGPPEGTVTVDDLVAFLSAFFTACP